MSSNETNFLNCRLLRIINNCDVRVKARSQTKEVCCTLQSKPATPYPSPTT